MDFRQLSAGISRKDKIRSSIIKQKMNVERSLLDDIKNNFNDMAMFKEMKKEIAKRSYEMASTGK